MPRTMKSAETPMMAAVTAATTATRRVRQPAPGIIHIYTPRPGRVPAQPPRPPSPGSGEGDQGPITLVVVVVADDDAGVASRPGGRRPVRRVGDGDPVIRHVVAQPLLPDLDRRRGRRDRGQGCRYLSL